MLDVRVCEKYKIVQQRSLAAKTYATANYAVMCFGLYTLPPGAWHWLILSPTKNFLLPLYATFASKLLGTGYFFVKIQYKCYAGCLNISQIYLDSTEFWFLSLTSSGNEGWSRENPVLSNLLSLTRFTLGSYPANILSIFIGSG